MADSGFQDKTEQATPKRQKEAQEKGQVAKSMEVTSVFVLCGAVAVFYFSGPWMFGQIKLFMHEIFIHLGDYEFADFKSSQNFLIMVFQSGFLILFPLFLTIAVVGIAGNVVQIGFVYSTKALMPNFSKLSPSKGFKKIFSVRSLVELVKSIFKLIIVGVVAYITVKKEIDNIPFLIDSDIFEILSFLGICSLKICFVTSLVLIFMAALDFGFQKFQHEKELKMTKQEVKEESKQTEGDPKVKQRIRSVQMEMMRKRMINQVPEATVIITNPTRLAIAIKFEFGEMHAPQVVAKGAGVIAAQIRKKAREHDIPLVENKPLAQIMFKTVEIGDYIPAELYQAVAEILAYIYRLKGNSQ